MSGKLPGDARRFMRLESVDRDVDEELGFHFDRTVSLTQMDRNGRLDFWFVRMNGEESATLQAVRRDVLTLDNRIRYADAETFEAVLQPKRQAWELGATMFGMFGLLALVVAAIGLYSVLAFDVAQRMRELGLRTALGASTGKLLRMVLSRAIGVTITGLVIGCAAAFALAPRFQALLFDTSPHDPATFGIVTVTLLAVAVAAAAIPGWRATRVDPNVTLRAD